ncbi:stage III sporulation protein AD [Anaerobranca californiensis DSM 14826]|jgi:stage III sporulation protein AD|uniref:Stage III sporulation protein AD n=1 Tax=Anaerobranca californiensis DSM 14826 TaxID=1120989 RepID=A0A1M6L7G2_9FIRM|nr:stage III sporulation protein AD [Anaerobranca californiensis]SHJ67198.1 stage III sporulation protein AD [Anaerobranca californiensis DSM 14826]
MNIMSFVAFAIITTVLVVIVKQQKPEIAMQIRVVAAAVIFLALASSIYYIMKIFEDLALQAELNIVFLGTILRIIGIAYITEFGAQICQDANENTLANKVILAGKTLMLILAIPIISTILKTLITILP